jgi:hypothetical protein
MSYFSNPTWAALVLGKSWEKEDLNKATPHIRQPLPAGAKVEQNP